MILLQLDKAKLERRMALAGFDNFDEVAAAARGHGHKLSARTIYNMVNGENWSREKLEALCQALRCQPADIVSGWQNGKGEIPNTHALPQPDEELQAAAI